MVIGQIVVVAAAALALQLVLPAIWSGFQLIGTDTAVTSADGAANAAVLGVILLVLTTLVNILDNRVMSVINRVGVTAEIIGAVLIIVLLLTHSERSPGITFHTTGAAQSGLFGALMVGSFAAAYVMIGFDSAGEMSEETHHPRRTAPRTILVALGAAGLLATLIVLGGLLAAPSLTDGHLSVDGLSYVLTSSLGDGVGRVLLADVVVAIAVATLAIQTAACRMLFSMARDGQLPFSARLAKVNPRTGMPSAPAVVVGVLAAALLLLNFASPDAFLAIGTTCIVMLYLAYAMVTGPLLVRRLRGGFTVEGTDEAGAKLFSLGRWGVPVNTLALLYGLIMTVNLAWPRAAVYDPAGGHWYFQWFTVLFLTVTVVIGVAYRAYKARAVVVEAPEAVAA
jgi:urea carboxylase system permease